MIVLVSIQLKYISCILEMLVEGTEVFVFSTDAILHELHATYTNRVQDVHMCSAKASMKVSCMHLHRTQLCAHTLKHAHTQTLAHSQSDSQQILCQQKADCSLSTLGKEQLL